MRYGQDQPDEDGLWNDSDPYVEVIAYNSEGTSVRRVTSSKGGDQSHDWNEHLFFDSDAWKTFDVRVWDSDSNADDPLSRQWTWTVQPLSHFNIRLDCYSGYIIFDYHLAV